MADNGMRDANHAEEPKRFEPKNPVQLDPPKDDPITPEYLAKCNGTNEGFPTLVAIKGTVFDVTKNEAYGPKGQYKVFAGKEPNRALAQSSLKPEDCVPEWEDLPDKEKTVLDEWFTFFSKRYNVVGKVQRANLPPALSSRQVSNMRSQLLTDAAFCIISLVLLYFLAQWQKGKPEL